jgi:hypothetical protein
MKKQIRIAALALACAITFIHQSFAATPVDGMEDIEFWVGTGANEAVLVISWNDDKNLPSSSFGEALAWGYRWETGQTRTGEDMLKAIELADPRLAVAFQVFSFGTTVYGMGYDLDADGGTFTFDTENGNGSASDADDHFQEGFISKGFWGYFVGAADGEQRPGWNEAQVGFSARTLSDGSWDAWSYTTDLVNFTIPPPEIPAAAAVPEPGTMALLAGAAGILVLARRGKRR